MNSEEYQNIDIDIEDAKRAIQKMEMLQRLQKNADFVALVEEAYFKEEASNIVIAKAIPHLRKAEHQAVFDNRIIAIGEFRQWLAEIYTQGGISAKALIDAEAMQNEMQLEE